MPAVITPEAPLHMEDTGPSRGRLEVVSTNGRRVIVDRDVDVDALLLSLPSDLASAHAALPAGRNGS